MVNGAVFDQGVQIRPDVAYDLPALRSLGLGTHAIRKARREGLEVHRFGRRSFVLGSDLIDQIKKSPIVGE